MDSDVSSTEEGASTDSSGHVLDVVSVGGGSQGQSSEPDDSTTCSTSPKDTWSESGSGSSQFSMDVRDITRKRACVKTWSSI